MRIHGTRQNGFFTKVPNLTVRDHALSFTARGLLAYMLSLPDGAREDVKTLANKSVEGRGAVSRALHELESRGYLARTKSRDDEGRIRTHVEVFADRDGASVQVEPATVTPGTGRPGGGKSGSKPEESGFKDSLPPVEAVEEPHSGAESVGREGGEPSRSISLLTRLGRDEPRLHLAASEAASLAPLVDAWLAKGATPNHVTSALTGGLPERVHQAAALLRHRLVTKMPAEAPPRGPRFEWHECADCGAPLRAAGLCQNCTNVSPQRGQATFQPIGRAGFERVRAQLRISTVAA
ncbi:helix-turn-helix domain-containing protein [Catenulispora pinisilvae]|uniref:helix-turn-helix domain-containing protein n=1 Tax=Catenulispora pinisilvae TaxID=2705253 RepID=UPI001891DBCA|nr:helix-turn-helix domain-containing protein [Catenulispora pinisilvae]